jgi:hypothetical protein
MFSDKQLPAYVISTPNSPRKDSLIAQLKTHSGFQVIEIQAKMLTNDDHDFMTTLNRNSAFYRAIYGRNVTAAEIGCALSHNEARRLLSLGSVGGLIFEDDARLNNVNEVYNYAIQFLRRFHGKKFVLSLYDGYVRTCPRFKFLARRLHFLGSFGPPASAVAYVLTPSAASALYRSNSSCLYLADWPESRVKFRILVRTLVRHGDTVPSSTIVSNPEQDFRLNKSYVNRFRLLFGYRPSQGRNIGLGFWKFFKLVWLRRIYSKMNHIKFIFYYQNL